MKNKTLDEILDQEYLSAKDMQIIIINITKMLINLIIGICQVQLLNHTIEK